MDRLFSNKDLKNMIIPLFLEQLLLILVGISDVFIISFTNEASVSGVSLVASFDTIFIYLFTALAAGGAVIISQYIGNKNLESASESSSQLLMFSTIFSTIIMILILFCYRNLLGLLFGKVEKDVMEACIRYLKITVLSYPAMAIYNSGAALCRSIGKTKITMNISIIANIINIVGNILGVFYFKMGVAGVAYPSLISRIFSAVIITVVCFREKEVSYKIKYIFSWNRSLLKKILSIAIPNGIENGIFQLVKVALSSIVALFGTYQIAANGIAQSIWSMSALSGVAMAPVFITVIGQCVGAKDYEQADYYFSKLAKLTIKLSVVWNTLMFFATFLLLRFYNVSEQTKFYVILLVLIHNTVNSLIYPYSGPVGNGLRAAGDVKYTMYISIFTTVAVRLVFSVILAMWLNMGVIGIAFAMCLDWTTRAIIFKLRVKSGKWKEFKVI